MVRASEWCMLLVWRGKWTRWTNTVKFMKCHKNESIACLFFCFTRCEPWKSQILRINYTDNSSKPVLLKGMKWSTFIHYYWSCNRCEKTVFLLLLSYFRVSSGGTTLLNRVPLNDEFYQRVLLEQLLNFGLEPIYWKAQLWLVWCHSRDK